MSELLQNWLNNDVGLSTNVSNFERDFASGYLFGEILHKFRQQDDFDLFRSKGTYEAKIANFKRLEPTFKALGIKLTATQSNAMMNGERGAALRLLYQLKMASERLLLASDTQGAQARAGAARGQAAPPHAGVTKGIRVPREQFDGHERRFFEHRLRATCLNVKQARMDKVTRRFDQEKQKQELVAYELDGLEQARIAEQREIHRYGVRERLWQNRGAKDEWNAMSAGLWHQNMQAKAARERRDVDFEASAAQRQRGRLERAQAAAAAEVREGVDAFEGSLAGLGFPARPRREASDSGSSSGHSEDGERLVAATTQAASARELVEALQSRMPHAQELEQEAGLFLRKIKESKRAGSVARKERERRRRRVLVEQQREQEILEEGKLEEVLLEKLGRESVEERAISYSVWKTQQYEGVIARNRQSRQQAYAARRKEGQREAVRRDQDLMQEMLEAVTERQVRERARYRAVERRRRAQQHAQLVQECEGILDLVAEMAFAGLQQEQLADSSEADETLWREWTSLFAESLPVMAPPGLAASAAAKYPLTAVPAEPDLASPPAAVLDGAALREYVEIRGQWAIRGAPARPGAGQAEGAPPAGAGPPFDAAEELGRLIDEQDPPVSFAHRLSRELDLEGGRPVNYRLGALVAALLDRAYALGPCPQPPPMPDAPLKLVLTGKPFAGKRTLAARLAESYNLQVIDVDELVRECLSLSKRPDLPTTRPVDVMSFTAELMDEHCRRCEEEGNPYIRQLQGIGYELQGRLDRGEAVDNETYVEMICTKIRSLFPGHLAAQPPAGREAAASAAGTARDGAEGPPPDSGPGSAAGEAGPEAADADAPGGAPAGAADPPAQEGGEGPGGPQAAGADAPPRPDLNVEPSGWIVLGFPEDRQRFALFERFLSGWVEPGARPALEAELRKADAAILAPRPPQDPPPFELAPGGYDLHLRLDVDGDEVVRRAVGRRLDPATSLGYHLEDHPPIVKHQVIFERLVPVDELSNSMGSLTQRIHSFDVGQPEVDFYLSYFGPFPDFPRLVCIDANRTMEEVYDSLDEQAAMLLQRKRAQRAKEAADAEAKREAEAMAAEGAEAVVEALETDGVGEKPPQAPSPPPEADRAQARSKAATPTQDAPGAEGLAGAATAEDPAPVLLAELPGLVEGLEGAVFGVLLREWREMQERFLGDARRLFCWHRAHLADFQSGLHGIHQRFIDYLLRPDDKQSLVDRFVLRFNSFSEEYPEMRQQDLTKDELHQRADDLQDELRELVEHSREENLEQLEAVERSQWVEAQAEVLAAQIQHAVQLEARRYHAACQLLSDFYHGALGTALPPPREAPPRIDALGQEEEPPPPPSGGADPKKKAKEKRREDEPRAEVSQRQGPQRLRRFVEAAADPETGAAAEAHWEFPFLEGLLAQAHAVLWSLAEYSAPAAAERAEPEQPKAKAKGRASPPPDKKGAKAEEAAPAPAAPAPALYVDLQQALLAERVAYTHRLCVIRNWAERRLLAMSEAAVAAFAQFRDWVVLRHQKELAAVSGLIEIVKQHIESEEVILARLTLEGSHLHRHPNVRLRAPAPPVVPPPLEGAAPWRWTVGQLHNLLDVLANAARALSPGARTLPAQSLAALLARLLQPAREGAREELRVPPSWQQCSAEQLHGLCGLFDHPPTGSVDCVEFLLHVSLLHSPLGWPSLEALLRVRKFLEPHVPAGASWPDFWVAPETLAEAPLFSDPRGQEAAFAARHRPSTALAPAAFDRPREHLRWIGRVLQAFPAPLRQWQAWELEAAWHDYRVRGLEDAERGAEMFDDMKSLLGESPRPAADSMMPLLTPPPPDAAGGSAAEAPRPLPPRPKPPRGLPEPPAGGGVNVRQLLACLCLGASPEDGVKRALAVLGPGSGSGALVAAPDLHAALVQLGARPLPPPEGDGRPRYPSFEQLCEVLELGPGAPRTKAALRAADLGGSERVQRVLARTGLARRHCRAELERLFPKRGGGR